MEEFIFTDIALDYVITEDKFRFREDYPTPEVTVPKGLVTDGASVPRWLQGLYPAYYKYFPSAAVHDYMYGSGLYERKECDDLFRDNMRYRLKLSWRYWVVMWVMVRLFGGSHFTKRKAEGNIIQKR